MAVINIDPFKKPSSLRTNLIAYYKLNESSGTIRDVANGHNSSAVSATYGAAGKIETAMSFSGAAGQYITLADSADWTFAKASSYSLSAWVYLSSSTQPDFSCIFGIGSGPELYLRNQTGGNFHISYYEGGQSASDTESAFSTSAWYHILVTKTAGSPITCNFYKNGTSTGSSTALDPAVPDQNPAAMYIGGNPDGENFNGRICELGIWNKVLTATEISDLYNAGIGLSFPF